MSALAEKRIMAKRDKAKPRNDIPVRVDAALIRDARTIAAYRDISLAEYVSEALKPVVSRDLQSLEQELAKRPKPPRARKNGGEKP